MTKDELREALAEYAHEAWSGWMKYMVSKIDKPYRWTTPAGEQWATGQLPEELHARWKRQMNTPYAELPEREKESDRIEADRILKIVKRRSDDSLEEEWETLVSTSGKRS